MRDRRNGTVLAGLGVAMLVLVAADRDLGSWPGRVELALACLALTVGVVLVVAGRSR